MSQNERKMLNSAGIGTGCAPQRQAPQVVESQVTYPLVTALLGVPKVKVVRGQSMFGASFVYVIFKDGTDLYWARSRVLEYLKRYEQSLADEGVAAERREPEAWSSLARTLVASNEFLFVD